jgi:Putative prokaryotic signal transducing protein
MRGFFVTLISMEFIQIGSFDNYISANLQLSLLQEEGIQCYIQDEYTVTIDPLLSPAIGGMKIMVYEPQTNRAKEIIEEAGKAFLLQIDCPHCGRNTLQWKTEIRKPSGLWQTLTFLLINGQAEEVKKYIVCVSCGSKFDEIPG